MMISIKETIKRICPNLILINRIKFKLTTKNTNQSSIKKIKLPSMLNTKKNQKKGNQIKYVNKFAKTIKQFPFFKRKNNSDKHSDHITVIFYLDQVLTILSITRGGNTNIINGSVEIPIPGYLIGKDQVENPKELSQIILDMLNILNTNSNPILLILPSSIFSIISLVSRSGNSKPTELEIKANTPFLPYDTYSDINNIKYKKNSFNRIVFSSKKLINGWINSLEIINLPVIGITFPSLHLYDEIKDTYIDESFILADIESNSIQLIMTDKHNAIKSYKLPYGSILYCNKDEKSSINDFFDRLKTSINIIEKENNYDKVSNIIVFGQGLDSLILNRNIDIPSPFFKADEIKDFNNSKTNKSNIKNISNINQSLDSKILVTNLILNISKL